MLSAPLFVQANDVSHGVGIQKNFRFPSPLLKCSMGFIYLFWPSLSSLRRDQTHTPYIGSVVLITLGSSFLLSNVPSQLPSPSKSVQLLAVGPFSIKYELLEEIIASRCLVLFSEVLGYISFLPVSWEYGSDEMGQIMRTFKN